MAKRNGRLIGSSKIFMYDVWVSTHLKRICSVIDNLPNVQFEVSERSDAGESGLSQGLERHLDMVSLYNGLQSSIGDSFG